MNCPHCKAPLKNPDALYARFANGRLRLTRTLHCTSCRFTKEEDSFGLLPREIRIQLLAQGAWGIRGADQQALARAVASILNRSEADISKFLVDDDGATPMGLQAEAEWAAHRLGDPNAKVVRINAADGIFAL